MSSSENVTLTRIDLSFNDFGREGAIALGQAVKKNNVVEELNVRSETLLSLGLIIR